MQIDPQTVIIKKRVRKNMGEIEALMISLQKYGQLSPIIINHSYELLAGHRRLQAAKLLGWKSLDAIMVDRVTEKEKLEIELEENVQRLDLSPEELSEAFFRLEKLKRKSFWRRIWDFIKKLFRK